MSAETQSISKWKELPSFPFKFFSPPFLINNHEFVVAASKINSSNGDGIYKFDTHKNEWIKIFDYDENFKCNIYSATYDDKNKLLHVCDFSDVVSKVLTFDLKTKNKTTLKEQQYKTVFRLIFVENKLHQICNYVTPGGTEQNGDHYVYNAAKQFQKITTFASFGGLYCSALIYLKSQQSIVSFGGFDTRMHVCKNSIYRFSFVDSKWKELTIKMPNKLTTYGLVLTKNEQYIIILGGCISANEFSDDIFIYDVRNNIFTKSKMKCPNNCYGRYYAVMVNNSKRDEITSFGFVNDCYRSNNFVGIQLLPHYLIKIICCYFCYEEIYLLERTNGHDTVHWKINVDDILLNSTVLLTNK